jgi:hypothetical protein
MLSRISAWKEIRGIYAQSYISRLKELEILHEKKADLRQYAGKTIKIQTAYLLNTSQS